MTGRDLGAKVSSLFDVAAQHRPLKNAGSSVISFACDPRHDEEAGLHKVKKVNPQYNMIYICKMLLKPMRACSTFACKALTRVWCAIQETLEDVVGIKYH